MLRNVDEWDDQYFAFHPGGAAPAVATTVVAVDGGSGSPTVTIDDADFLFHAEFKRAGSDLILSGDGRMVIVRDYFAAEQRATLLSGEGAALSPRVVEALAGPQAPGQYAQAGGAQGAVQAVGRVAKVDGDVVVVRNGVAMTVKVGDAILKGDVLQTRSGQLGVTFNDGSTINLTENARLVVNEFVYDPNGSANSQILDLVQGSLTFISGEVAHTGDMQIGTPVATMGIRGTVGGVTGAETGQVSFFIVQSDRGAVLTDSNGTVIAQVVQNGPLVVVRPVGPLQVLAEEVQKSPQQLAAELAALQHIVSVQSVGQQIIQQFLNPQDPNNPQAKGTDHTQIQLDIPKSAILPEDGDGNGNNTVTVTVITNINNNNNGDGNNGNNNNIFDQFTVDLPTNLPPIIFAPFAAALHTDEDNPLTFFGQNAISVFDKDTAILTVTLSATLGTLTLGGVSGLTFAAGDGTDDAAMTFTGTHAAINAALNGLTFTPTPDENGQGSVVVTVSDGEKTITHTLDITINPVNDVPVIGGTTAGTVTEDDDPIVLTTGGTLTIVDPDEGESSFVPQAGTAGSNNFGTFTLEAGGKWSYTADNTQPAIQSLGAGDTATDSFTAVSADGTATQLVTVTIVGTNDVPVVTPSAAVVSEEGLANGIADTAGNADSTDANEATGTITATDADGEQLTFTLGQPTTPLKSGGVNITWDGIGTNTLIGKADGTAIVRAEIDDNGAYKVTLFGPVDHSDDSEEDVVTFDIPVNVSDGQSTDHGSLTVTIEDDKPVATDHSIAVEAGIPQTTVNLVIILDVSGSMGGSNIALAKDALDNLLTTNHVQINQVMAVSFATAATVNHNQDSVWTDAASANTFIQGLVASGGTDYQAALAAVMGNWGDGPSGADKTLVYFISDGEPSSPLTASQTGEWETFLSANGVDVSYAIGISADLNDPDLAPIAWTPDDANFSPIILSGANGLDTTLQGTVPVADTHNIFIDDTSIGFGADGGRILSVEVDGVTYSWDGIGTITKSGLATGTLTGSMISLDTVLGGHFEFYFAAVDGHQAGDWSYLQPDQIAQLSDEIFHYVLMDNDGDTAGADIAISVSAANLAPVFNAQSLVVADAGTDETRVTGLAISDADDSGGTATLDITVDKGILTFAHPDVEGDGASVLTVSGSLDFLNGLFGADAGFVYSTSGASGNDKITMTVTDAQGGTDTLSFVFKIDNPLNTPLVLDGTAGNDIIFATGDDDTLTGNGGRDTFVFSAEGGGGNDVITDFGLDDFLYFDAVLFNQPTVADLLNGPAVQDDIDGSAVFTTLSGSTIRVQGVSVDDFQHHQIQLV